MKVNPLAAVKGLEVPVSGLEENACPARELASVDTGAQSSETAVTGL